MEAEPGVPAGRGWEYARVWSGDTYTRCVGINAQQFTGAVVCFFQENGCRFGVVEVRRQLADNDSRFFARFLDDEAVAKASAILGKDGWKLVPVADDTRHGQTLFFAAVTLARSALRARTNVSITSSGASRTIEHRIE
jgi:hypothetical protein